MSYVDGFVTPVPKAKLEAYQAMARIAGEAFKDHGALAYVESLADDAPYGELTSFPRAVQAKDDEIVVLSWIVYADRASRDAIMGKVMADPRLKDQMDNPPFDARRMIFGGFETFIQV